MWELFLLRIIYISVCVDNLRRAAIWYMMKLLSDGWRVEWHVVVTVGAVEDEYKITCNGLDMLLTNSIHHGVWIAVFSYSNCLKCSADGVANAPLFEFGYAKNGFGRSIFEIMLKGRQFSCFILSFGFACIRIDIAEGVVLARKFFLKFISDEKIACRLTIFQIVNHFMINEKKEKNFILIVNYNH